MTRFLMSQTPAFDVEDAFESELNKEQEDWGAEVLTQEQARALEATLQQFSLWSVLKIQALAGLTVVVLASFFGWWSGVCALAGVLCVLLPTLLFVWKTDIRVSRGYSPSISLVKFYFWEFVKVVGIIAMLIAAVLWLKPLIWAALLTGFVVTVKAYGIGCFLLLRRINKVNG